MAYLIGKSRREVEEMLKKDEIIELNLNEKSSKRKQHDDDLRIYE